jgi:hypothetical protein
MPSVAVLGSQGAFSRFVIEPAGSTASGQAFPGADDSVVKTSIIVSITTTVTYDYRCVRTLDRCANRYKLVEMNTINAPMRAVRHGGQAA